MEPFGKASFCIKHGKTSMATRLQSVHHSSAAPGDTVMHPPVHCVEVRGDQRIQHRIPQELQALRNSRGERKQVERECEWCVTFIVAVLKSIQAALQLRTPSGQLAVQGDSICLWSRSPGSSECRCRASCSG